MQDQYLLASVGQVALLAPAEKTLKNIVQTPAIEAINLGPGAVMLAQLGMSNESRSRKHMVNVPALLMRPMERIPIYDFYRHTQLEREDADFEDLVERMVKAGELHVLIMCFATPNGWVEVELPMQIQFTSAGFVLGVRLLPTRTPLVGGAENPSGTSVS